MAVNFGDGFFIGANKPIDFRMVVNTPADLTTIPYPYRGMLVSVKNDGGFVKTYRLTQDVASPLTNWDIVGSSAALASLTDVQLTNTHKGDVLMYGTNAFGTPTWINRGPIITTASAGTNGNLIFTFSDGTYSTIQISGGALENNDYSSNVFVTDGETYNQAISTLDSVLSAIAPAKAGSLNSTSLSLTNTSTFQAIVPSGLPAAWTDAPGTLIFNYITDNTYTLTSPSPSTAFDAGLYSSPSTYGTVSHLRNNTSFVSRNLTLGTGSASNSDVSGSSTLNVTGVSLYNSIWTKANANIAYTQNSEGKVSHKMSSTVAGTTFQIDLNYDSVHSAPSFSIGPSVAQTTPVIKYLSGIQYYGLNSILNVSFTAATGIYNRCYHPTAVAVISGNAFPTFNLNPASTPVYTDTFPITNRNFTLSTANYSSGAFDGALSVTLQKPDGQIFSQSATYFALNAFTSARVNTYGTVSTTKYEGFLDEANRLVQSTNSAFDSTIALPNGEAQVLNGSLVYGNTDYPSKSGDQRYDRKFTVSPQQNGGSMTFVGFTPSNIASYNTGNINMFLQLDTNGFYYDLGRPFGSNNGTGDGSSLANSIGARVSTTGGTLNYTFGTYSTFPTNQYRMIIIFKNNTYSITSITIA